MTFARLVVRDLLRNPLRAALTTLAAAVGVLAFVFLQTMVALFYLSAEGASVDRLIVRNRAGFTQPLPLSYRGRIAAVPGVVAITHEGWFGGQLSERRSDQFANFYVDTASFLTVFNEYVAPSEQIAAWMADPCGAMVGEKLAAQRGWKVGDRVVLHGTIFPGDWPFTVRGIYGGNRPQVDTTAFVFGYRCLNEKLPAARKDQVGLFAIRVDDPGRSAAVAAQIDQLFANTPFETHTESERAFQLSFVSMLSAILAAVRTVSLVILAIILLVVANTLAMGVREKTVDLATLKAIGFGKRHLLSLVLFEALALGVVAAVLGVAAAPPLIHLFVVVVEKQFGPMPVFHMALGTVLIAFAASVAVSLFAALIPALRAARLPVVEGLRRLA